MDWKRYRLAVVGVVALLLVGLTWFLVDDEREGGHASAEDAPTLPTVVSDDLTEIEIRRPEDEGQAIRLVRDGDSWRLAAPVEASAASTAISTALEKLGDLEVVGRAATRAQHHERLEVDEEHGIRVLAKAGDETVIDLWIGAFQAGNTMVRVEGEDEVLMVRGSIKFAFNKPVRDWRDRTILELTAADVNDLRFTNEHGSFHFHKGEAWEQVLDPAAEGQEAPAPIEEFSASRVASTVTALARLRAADFAAADVTAETAGLGDAAPRVVLSAGEGDEAQTITLRVGSEGEGGQRHVQREGDETIYLVSSFMGERLLPNVEAFQPSDEPEAPPPGAGAPHGMPPGMGGPGGPGGGQIPPEVMRQIQQQLQQQGAAGQ